MCYDVKVGYDTGKMPIYTRICDCNTTVCLNKDKTQFQLQQQIDEEENGISKEAEVQFYKNRRLSRRT